MPYTEITREVRSLREEVHSLHGSNDEFRRELLAAQERSEQRNIERTENERHDRNRQVTMFFTALVVAILAIAVALGVLWWALRSERHTRNAAEHREAIEAIEDKRDQCLLLNEFSKGLYDGVRAYVKALTLDLDEPAVKAQIERADRALREAVPIRECD